MKKRLGSLLVFIASLMAAASQPADFVQPTNTWVKRSPLAQTPASPRLGYEGACVWDSRRHLLIRGEWHQ